MLLTPPQRAVCARSCICNLTGLSVSPDLANKYSFSLFQYRLHICELLKKKGYYYNNNKNRLLQFASCRVPRFRNSVLTLS